MVLKNLLLICSFVIFQNSAFATSSSEVAEDLDLIIEKIEKVDRDVKTKSAQKQSLSRAIDDSMVAINKSNALLENLKAKRGLTARDLDVIGGKLAELTEKTDNAEQNIKEATRVLYKKILLLKSDSSSSVLSAKDNLDRKLQSKYLTKVLIEEEVKYKNLSEKLTELKSTLSEMGLELVKLDKELGSTSKRKELLQQDKKAKEVKAQELQVQIEKGNQELVKLKTQQANLNKLLQSLAQEKKVRDKQNLANKPQKANLKKFDYENNSEFFLRKLNKPVDGTILVNFGVMKGGLPNNGIVFKSSNSNVYAVSEGKVLYSDDLPGFGQMLVVDHGDNYVSIYSGILPRIKKNDSVMAGQIIANSGDKINQPMGGVYFELRHLGKPVNPAKLLK